MPISLFSKLPQCLSGAVNVNKSFFHGSYLWSQLAVQTDLGIRASGTMLPVALKSSFCVRGQHVRFEQMIRLFICVLMIFGGRLHSPAALCSLVDAARRFMQWGLALSAFFSQPLQPPAAECLETRESSPMTSKRRPSASPTSGIGTGSNPSIGPNGLHELATHLLALSHQLGCIQPGYRAC